MMTTVRRLSFCLLTALLILPAYAQSGEATRPASEDERNPADSADAWDYSAWKREDRFKRPAIGPGVLWDGTDSGALFGTYPNRWPYAETALYRNTPAIRYNRAEGFVLGIGSGPLDWDSDRRFKIVGQAGYAFALKRWRYEVGGEVRPLQGSGSDRLKLGASYRYNTVTEDLWKSNWIENTLAALLFHSDFFDYYQVRGWSAYAVGRLSRTLQLSAAFRSEEHGSLERNTDWSLFGGDFRSNPPADEGRVQSFLFAVEGGRVRSLNYLPIGAVLRAEAEVAPGLGSDFTFGRYVADGRLYLPVSAYSSLGLRLRGGLLAGDDAPFQKGFTIGGVGTVLGYPTNAFYGTRMLLGNAEYMIATPDLFGRFFQDLQFFGTANAGWVGTPGDQAFNVDELLPSLGIGLGLDERNLRFELAFPLRDVGHGYAPSLWFRLSPTF